MNVYDNADLRNKFFMMVALMVHEHSIRELCDSDDVFEQIFGATLNALGISKHHYNQVLDDQNENENSFQEFIENANKSTTTLDSILQSINAHEDIKLQTTLYGVKMEDFSFKKTEEDEQMIIFAPATLRSLLNFELTQGNIDVVQDIENDLEAQDRLKNYTKESRHTEQDISTYFSKQQGFIS